MLIKQSKIAAIQRRGSNMNIKLAQAKKVFILILGVIVAILVVFALYSNKSRFYDCSSSTIKYSQVTIDENTNIDEVILRYADYSNKEKFISEVKKVNKLSSLDNESVYGKTIYIPVVQN